MECRSRLEYPKDEGRERFGSGCAGLEQHVEVFFILSEMVLFNRPAFEPERVISFQCAFPSSIGAPASGTASFNSALPPIPPTIFARRAMTRALESRVPHIPTEFPPS
jgi:hypothetical protein